LVEDGRAELDAPVRTYFPEFRLGDESVAAIRELIFEPLGVERSCFTAGEAIIHRVAVGHVLRQGQCMVARPWSLGRTVHPSGAS
jgi:CubicO group peptidase (beta-lactamase class C family)